MFSTVTTSVKWHVQSCTYHSSGAQPSLIVPSRLRMMALRAGRKIINNSHGILHPGRFRCKLTWQWGWKRRESSSGYLFVCYLPQMWWGKNYQTGSNWMQSARFLADFSASTAYPPTPWGKTSRNPHQIRRWHIKNCVTKSSNGCQRCGSSSSFLLGSFYCSPVYWGCTVSEGNALSGLPCRSGIWSWWLCDILGWGIAVSAEQETQCWSMGLLRQAYVQRSYGMVPLCCSKAPFSTFSLVNNHSSLLLLSEIAQDGNTHAALETDLPPTHSVLFKKWLIRKNEQILLLWWRVKTGLDD